MQMPLFNLLIRDADRAHMKADHWIRPPEYTRTRWSVGKLNPWLCKQAQSFPLEAFPSGDMQWNKAFGSVAVFLPSLVRPSIQNILGGSFACVFVCWIFGSILKKLQLVSFFKPSKTQVCVEIPGHPWKVSLAKEIALSITLSWTLCQQLRS